MSRILALTRDLVRVPRDAAQPVERGRRAFARAAIFLDQIHARERHVELGVARVFEQHEVALVVALRDLARAQEPADAVRFVHHVVARFQIGHVGGEGGELRFGGAGFGDQIGRIEKIFGAEDGDVRFGKNDAAPDQSFDQERAGGRAGDVGTLGEIGARGVGGIEAQLEGNRVFLENVGQPLQFARGSGEEDHAIAVLHQIARFGDGGLDVAVKRQRRPGRPSTGLDWIRDWGLAG